MASNKLIHHPIYSLIHFSYIYCQKHLIRHPSNTPKSICSTTYAVIVASTLNNAP